MTREEAIKKVMLGKTFDYKSPIELIVSDVQMKLEDSICEAVQNVGINVDKGELIKALEYDREQYKKGYEDALKQYGECNQYGEWKPLGEPDDLGIHSWHICSNCGFHTTWHMVDIFHFCPNCGADMRKEGEAE